jgi:transcriptional regulator with XRE-family HTH domain
MTTAKILAANIRRQREALGWSQEELAERSGTHRTYVSGIERGKRNPTIAVLGAFADALGVSPAFLLEAEK